MADVKKMIREHTIFKKRTFLENLCGVVLMTLAIVVLIVFVTEQSLSSKYFVSYSTYRDVMLIDEAKQITNPGMFYDWFDKVAKNMNPSYHRLIDANCDRPDSNFTSCDINRYLNGQKDAVNLGNDQIVLFYFTADRVAHDHVYPEDVGIALQDSSNINVKHAPADMIDPKYDSRFVSICANDSFVDTNNFHPWQNTKWCLLEDGFAGESGSTFEFNASGDDNFKFDTVSSSSPTFLTIMFKPGNVIRTHVISCDKSVTFKSEQCSRVMVQNGFETRASCRQAINDENTPLKPIRLFSAFQNKIIADAYTTNYPDLESYLNSDFGCETFTADFPADGSTSLAYEFYANVFSDWYAKQGKIL